MAPSTPAALVSGLPVAPPRPTAQQSLEAEIQADYVADPDQGWRYRGPVLAVTGRSITIKPWCDRPPVTFPVTTLLATGGLPKYGYEYGTLYKLADVRVGDHVLLRCAPPTNGVEVCRGISLLARPGGEVPRDYGPPEEARPWIRPWHVRANESQRAQERGEKWGTLNPPPGGYRYDSPLDRLGYDAKSLTPPPGGWSLAEYFPVPDQK
jgi:hypothetical protein